MSYQEDREFLAKYTQVIELSGDRGALVAICPQWQGRVMTSTCGGPEGESFGFINRAFIEAGNLDPRFNNYGAEDRMWLSPEGGPFSLWFKPGVEQTLDNWYTAPAINEGVYEVSEQPSGNSTSCKMSRPMELRNTAGTQFNLAATREVRLLDHGDLEKCFGAEAVELMDSEAVELVAYETVNTITNLGPTMQREKGLVSMWILSMLNSSAETVIIVPYKPGDESQLGPIVTSDYFGPVPTERLVIMPEAVLFLADSKFRAKIGTSQLRARNVLGAIDFRGGSLTLASFNMPDDPAACDYMNNAWDPDVAEPFV
ncbi:MAG: hypothetical protein JXM70_02080, partial [Pirellulales bacterium]|nr:hypothetical protein [Pirellulales bacterium]